MVLGKGTWVVAGAMVVVWMVLSGPSAPNGSLDSRSLPAKAVRDVVPGRVMTWNLCNPCESANDDRAAEIAKFAPQVIGVQEACVGDVAKIRDYLEDLHGLVYHVEYGSVLRNWGRCGGAPWNPGGYGQAILSATPMTDAEVVEYPDGGSEDRGYMAVTTTVGDRTVRVFNTHLAERRQEPVRAEQVGVLAKAIARHQQTVVIGDFNAVPDAAELTKLWPLAKDADPGCHPAPTATCRVTTDWQSKFDYVFLRGVASRGQHVDPNSVSDHHVVYADLVVG
ncbi:endonuclease/exonuclease/phosphatase family protein [Streptomyces sp. SID13726]|uniref:endonuclease/exonuclease/phosphatase family protein n=1 Tax=Streptomyces sp. SID13726 TaxID=2706058 RepID=UPI0013BC4EA3|nr:endonuclease/exonuclease/phosphatase family protein [Streptomyces sp. SID13726]NEB04973.1 endonuclease/exonuclease/phosphatase family protein [Streptomyces sp. SID13726]